MVTVELKLPEGEVRDAISSCGGAGHVLISSRLVNHKDWFLEHGYDWTVPALEFAPARLIYTFKDAAVALLFKLTFGG